MKGNRVKCLNPWDVQSKRLYMTNGVYKTLDAGQSQGGQAHGICYRKTAHPRTPYEGQGYEQADVSDTLNVFDSAESRTPLLVCYAIDQQGGKGNCSYAKDVMPTLCSDSHGTPHALCYAIEGNTVDRESRKNGRGWCENVSPTLNTQDKHAVCIAIEGNGARPSHQGNGFSESGTMYTLNTIEQHGVCYEEKR